MSRRLKTLEQVADELGLFDVMKDPVRWLSDQVRAKRIPARKIGAIWMMTETDIDEALDAWKTKTITEVRGDGVLRPSVDDAASPPVRPLSLTPTSRRRLKRPG